MTHENATLKPCPFCGHSDASVDDANDIVECSLCSATGSWAMSPKQAIAKWNKRPIEDAAQSMAKALVRIEKLLCGVDGAIAKDDILLARINANTALSAFRKATGEGE